MCYNCIYKRFKIANMISWVGGCRVVYYKGVYMEIEQKKALVTRFAKIEGHVRSIKTMTEEERDLETIMQQIAAVKKAMDAAAKLIYTEQMKELIEQGETDEVVIKKKIDSFIR
ncbi:hypothetical protein LmNIHS28_01273 [Listeria monocytogenes]|nr:hypothetical protein F2382_01448 [Listeria monocytogenes]GAM95341.1 hypothetical protein LmNIHS28_01273 [Listeria monocytogenes]